MLPLLDDVQNLGDPRGDKPSAKQILEVWAADFLAEFGSDARLHWGQIQGAYGPADLARGYPQEEIDAWYGGFRTLNPYGLFDTAWAKRVGMVARRAADVGPWPRYAGL